MMLDYQLPLFNCLNLNGDYIFKICYFYFMCIHKFIFVCMCNTCMPGDYAGQKRALDSLRLGLQMVVSLHMSSENQNQFPFNSSKQS